MEVVAITTMDHAFYLHTVAELKAEASRIESESELECQTQAREAEVAFLREQNQLEVSKAAALSSVEVGAGVCMVSI